MIVRRRHQFIKQFKKLDSRLKCKAEQVIALFMNHPTHPSLRNHALRGTPKGNRTSSVAANVRIIFQEFDDYVLVLFIDIGGHDMYR